MAEKKKSFAIFGSEKSVYDSWSGGLMDEAHQVKLSLGYDLLFIA